MSSRLGQLQDEVSTRGGASLTSVIMVGPPALGCPQTLVLGPLPC
jgi:hypothetical protein